MTYGDCIDYIDAWVEMHEDKEPKAKTASQTDIDLFFG